MKHFGNLFWTLILGGSLIAVVIGFAGGRSFGNAAVAQLHPRPAKPLAPAIARTFDRQLHGVNSLEEADDPRDAYDEAEAAVVDRPDGWAPAHFDSLHQRARVALVVVDAGMAGTPAQAFTTSPIPFTLVVPGGDDNGIMQAALTAGKTVLVDAGNSDPDGIRARIKAGAIGTLSDASDRGAARAMVAETGSHALVLDPLLQSDGMAYRVARHSGLTAMTRDVIVDGRDADPLVDALFASALGRAQRTGVAIVLLHARPHSLAAAERFAVRAQRDGVDVVSLNALDIRG